MGAFDNAFDDLPEGQPTIKADGLFDDLPTVQEKPKPAMGLGREVASGFLSHGDTLGQILTGVVGSPLLVVDAAARALTGKETGASEWYAQNVFNQFKAESDALAAERAATSHSLAGNLLNMGGGLVAAIPEMLMGGSLANTVKMAPEVLPAAAQTVTDLVLPAVKQSLTRAAVGAQPMAVPAGVEKFVQAEEAGMTPFDAARAGVGGYAGMTAMGMTPMGMAGSIPKRVATGAATMPFVGAGTTSLENIINAGNQKLQRDPYDVEARLGDVLTGGVMHGVMGPRAERPSGYEQTRRGYNEAAQAEAEATTLAADWKRYGPILEANGINLGDERAVSAINALKQREARAAEAQAATEAADTPSPAQLDIAAKQTPQPVINVDSQGRAEPANRTESVGMKQTMADASVNRARTLFEPEIEYLVQKTGLTSDEIRRLSPEAQFRLLERQSRNEGDGQTMYTSFEGGDGVASPAEKPNVPGDRMGEKYGVTEEGAQEVKGARQEGDYTQDISKRDNALRERLKVSLDGQRSTRDELESRVAEIQREIDTGRQLSEKEAEAFARVKDARDKAVAEVRATEDKIYDLERTTTAGTRQASGTSSRPFKGDFPRYSDSGEPMFKADRAAEFGNDQRAEGMKQKTHDDLIREWSIREQARKERERQRQQNEEDRRRSQENQYYSQQERKQRANSGDKKQGFSDKHESYDEKTGTFATDQFGFVKSTKGGPIKFSPDHPDPRGNSGQKKAARWILGTGNKAKGVTQTFEIANHPSGDGFTVRVTKTAEPPKGEPKKENTWEPGTQLPSPDAPKGEAPKSEAPRAEATDVDPWNEGAPAASVEPAIATRLREMVKEFGWYERGGNIIREFSEHGEQDGAVVGRTSWIPSVEWMAGKPKFLTESNIADIVERGLAGTFGPRETRAPAAFEWMKKVAQDHVDAKREMEEALRQEQLAENALNQRAAEVGERYGTMFGEDALESLASRFENPAKFIAEARRLIDENQSRPQNENAADSGSVKGADENNRLAEGEPDAAAKEAGGAGEPARPDLNLDSYTPEQLRAEERRRADAERAEAERQRELEAKAKADAESPDFGLTGSDRPADQKGQTDAFGNSEYQQMRDIYGNGPVDMNMLVSPKNVRQAIEMLFGKTSDNVQHWRDIRGDLQDIKDKTVSPKGGPIQRITRWLFDSAHGSMRAVANRYDSPTLHSMIDHFQVEAGSDRVAGSTFDHAVHEWTNKQLTRLQEAIGPIQHDVAAFNQAAAKVRSNSFGGNTTIDKAAREIAAILKESRDYMVKAGVDVGEVKNGYYPREFDIGKVLRAPDAFKKAVEQAYREAGHHDPKAAAEALYDSVMFRDDGGMFKQSAGQVRTPFTEGRVFGKNVDSPNHPLNKFLEADPAANLTSYLQRASRRAEIARRFGDRFSHWNQEWTDANGVKHDSIVSMIEKEGGRDAISALQDFVSLSAGLRNPRLTDGEIRMASVIRTWASLMFLDKATLSSLTEFITPAIRAAGADMNAVRGQLMGVPANIFRSFHATVADLLQMTKTAKERRAFAEDLHLIASSLSDSIVANRFSGGEPASKFESRVLDNYFRRTGLNAWTNATKVASVDLGRIYLRRLIKNVAEDGDRLSIRFLNEMGVPKGQEAAFAQHFLKINDGHPTSGDLTGVHGEQYRTAIGRFLDQSIMAPNRSTRPTWASSPLGSIVAQLQSYSYAFYENVWKRAVKLAYDAANLKNDYNMAERARLLQPLATIPVLVAAAFIIGEGRDALLGDPNKRKKEDGTDKVLKAISRGAPLAPVDGMLNFISAARYQKSFSSSISGPAFGKIGEGMEAARAIAIDNKPGTNAAERKLAKAAYDLVIEPSVNLGLSIAGVPSVGTAAITQAVGAGQTKEAFVTAIAGPEKRKDRKF